MIGQVSDVCVDAQDHSYIVNRNDMTDKEGEVAQQAPPYIEFDPDGNEAGQVSRCPTLATTATPITQSRKSSMSAKFRCILGSIETGILWICH